VDLERVTISKESSRLTDYSIIESRNFEISIEKLKKNSIKIWIILILIIINKFYIFKIILTNSTLIISFIHKEKEKHT